MFMCPTARNAPGRPRDEALQSRRREEILDAAAPLFAERGFASTDVQVLADLLQVGKGTIYRYFPSKADLFLATVERGVRGLHQAIEARVADVADPLEQIVVAIHAYLEFFDAHPALVELFIQERAQFKDRKTPTYFAVHAAHVGPWREMYQRLVQEGRVRDLPQTEDQEVVHDLLYGTILANYFTGRRSSHAEQAQNIVDIVFQGILTDSERKRRKSR
jgi:AcrR family transcriptional regulator